LQNSPAFSLATAIFGGVVVNITSQAGKLGGLLDHYKFPKKIKWLAGHKMFRERPMRVITGVVRWEYHRTTRSHVTLNLDGIKLVARPLDGNGRLICYFGDQFDSIFGFMRQYLKPGMIYVDVGANIGSHVLNAARVVGRGAGGKVYAFEAEPKTFDLMTKNIAYNNASASVEARNVAVTASDCVLTLYLNRDSAKNSLIRTGNGETVSVPGKRLGNLLPGGVKIDILKIDVEGADMDVLTGAEEIFSSAPPDVVIIEVFDVNAESDNSSAVLPFLLKRNYEMFSFESERLIRLGAGQTTMNAFAIHESAVGRVMAQFKTAPMAGLDP
jgi:FkbM family methyltransferase